MMALAQTAPAIAAPPPPAPRFVVPLGGAPIELADYRQEVSIVGQTVQTRLTLQLRNPNPRVLEGELQFPLAAGQAVTGFALDIDGQLRRAVPVAKAKGLQVFEDTVRGRVDPALLEASAGNQYKLRVYPLPPQGQRTVVLDIAQALPAADGREPPPLLLPLGLDGMAARQASLRVRIAGLAPAGVHWRLRGLPADALQLQPGAGADGGSELRMAPRPLTAPATLALSLALPAGTPVQAAHFDGEDFVYAEIPAPTQGPPRPAPRRLAIVWDASGSAAQRRLSSELAVMDALFARWQNLQVRLYLLRDKLEAPVDFEIRGGQWRALRERLQAEPFDGATQLGTVQLPREAADLALLFTDGHANFGERQPPGFGMPVFVLQSSLGSEAAALRAVAEAQGGALIDLLQATPVQALQRISTELPRLVELRSRAGRRWVAASRQAVAGRIAVAGIASEAQGMLEAVFKGPGPRETVQRVHWQLPPAQSDDAGAPLPAWRWALLQLDELALRPELHRAEIERLGQRFGLATRETSLIVLDTLADYLRHRIEPPAGPLRAAWQQQIGTQQAVAQRQQQDHLAQLLRRFQERQAWWATEFPKDAPAQARRDERENTIAIGGEQRARSEATGPADARRPAAPVLAAPAPAAVAPAAPATLAGRLAKSAEVADRAAAGAPPTGGAEQPAASIALSRWTPDAAYARRLRAAAPKDRYAVYLDERPGHLNSSAFFLDAADLFFEQGDAAIGLRVLSNLAEMALENRALLRILGYRLLQARQAALAVPVFERVREIAPHEPQSSRDLGLALADARRWQAAADALWLTASTRWEGGRFPDIDITALGELNAVIAKARREGEAVDVRAMDPRLLVNLPLGLRVVLAWDADNTDIDLYVTDPNGEQAYYGHQRTRQGGRMSADFTGGYGPEEFALRRPKPGVYTVSARFFGHRQQVLAPATTLMLRLATGFGTAAEQEQRVMLRLSGAGEVVKVGEFRVEGANE
ncbi:VIT domain-containing protein [Aquabacterium sp.]|uniref:VIT domain-containing protein n=1 Tax=Aquabacterium sp. TaxID=1872578 RepID=UPI0037835EC3